MVLRVGCWWMIGRTCDWRVWLKMIWRWPGGEAVGGRLRLEDLRSAEMRQSTFPFDALLFAVGDFAGFMSRVAPLLRSLRKRLETHSYLKHVKNMTIGHLQDEAPSWNFLQINWYQILGVKYLWEDKTGTAALQFPRKNEGSLWSICYYMYGIDLGV